MNQAIGQVLRCRSKSICHHSGRENFNGARWQRRIRIFTNAPTYLFCLRSYGLTPIKQGANESPDEASMVAHSALCRKSQGGNQALRPSDLSHEQRNPRILFEAA